MVKLEFVLCSKISIEKYPLPKFEEMMTTVGANTHFSKIDMKQAYLQIEVEEEDQKYLVVSTPKGLFKFLRLPFGLASSPGIFQRFISQLLAGIEGVNCFMDDVLICASSKADLYEKVKTVLGRLSSANIALNLGKCKIDVPKIEFLGHVISADGIAPSVEKLEAINKAPVPSNLNELLSLIGLVTYYSKFVHRFSDIMCPLYELTKKNVPFVWGKRQDVAYKAIKAAISKSELLTCFTGKSKLVVEVDASPKGVGAVLLQLENGVERPLMFASKKLTCAESNYSQTDREALAVVFGLNKFRYYLLGRTFLLRTDHKPLLGLFGKNKKIPENANARLTRWSIFLSQFQFDLVHKAGKTNFVADALSRLPIEDEFSHHVPTEYANMIESLDSYQFSFEQIQELTKKM